MSVSQTVVEIVRFTEQGLSEISARTKVFSQEISEAQKRMKVLSGLMNDPAYAKHAQQLDTVAKQYELTSLKMRNTAAAHALADGSAVKHLRTTAKLDQQYERIRRETELIYKYGERVGRFFSRHERTLAVMGKVGMGAAALAGGAAVAGMGLARQGFAGTVEQAKFDLEMKMLSRELAAVMKPVMEVMTKGARYIRQQLQSLDEGGQNMVMGGMLLGGTAAGAWALRAGGRMLGMFGGAGAAAAGTGAIAGGSLAAQAGGAAVGGAAGRGMLARAGTVARGAGVAAGPVVATVGGATSGDYGRMRSAGKSKFASAMVAAGGGIGDAYYSLAPWEDTNPLDEARKKHDAKMAAQGRGPDGSRRTVALAGGGYEETGTMHDRIQTAIGTVGGDLPSEIGLLRGVIERQIAVMREAMERRDRERERGLERPGG